MELAKPDSPSGWDLAGFNAVARRCHDELNQIKGDKAFVRGLGLIRNGVAAHHGLSRGKGMDASIAWTLSSVQLGSAHKGPDESQVAEYAVKLGRAVQEFGESLSTEDGKP